MRSPAQPHLAILAPLARLRGGEMATVASTTGLVGSTASLTKNILGIGVLTLAAGMGAGTGVGPATLAMIVTTLAAAYTFTLLGDACEISGLGATCSFQGLWAATLGVRTKWLVDVAIGSLTFSICTVYLICLGELLPPLLALVGAPRGLRTRRASVALSAAAAFPLCCSSSLAGLSLVSLLGVMAIGFTAVFSMVRWLDGSYAEGGRYHAAMPIALRPSLAALRRPWALSDQSAVLLANLGVALCTSTPCPKPRARDPKA